MRRFVRAFLALLCCLGLAGGQVASAQGFLLNSFRFGTAGNPYGLVAAGAVGSDLAGGSISLSYPAGIVANDALVAVVIGQLASGTETATTPSGWVLIGSLRNTAGTLFVFGKVAAGTESGSLSISHNGSVTNDQWRGVIVQYGGCDGTSPFVDAHTNSGSGSTITYPSVSLSAANQIKVDIGANTDGIHSGTTYGTPTGFNSDAPITGSDRPTGAVFEKTFGSSGATGTETGSRSSSGNWVSLSFGLLKG